MKNVMYKIIMGCYIVAALVLVTACNDNLDIQQAYPFTVETLPVPKKLKVGETAEIRCRLVRGGYYQPTTYQIRYFQPDGKGKLEMDDGTVFLPNDLYPLEKETFQRAVTEKNKEQIENQRFNDLFFELLRLYQSEISELCGTINKERDNEVITINYNNKDFFDFEKSLLQRAFKPTPSYEGNIKGAINLYMLFYIKHRTKVAACFRTLYRIYDLLDNADLREKIKKNYLKIIRAQLTDSELFFIRYNGMTYYGDNFTKYINKYNVLKHLPAFDLLEFKDWWKDLTQIERTGINIVFHNSTRLLRRILLKKEILILHFEFPEKI